MIHFLLTGHVDTGKSTTGGHLLYKCGVVDEREAQKIFDEAEADKMSSFRWARFLDTYNEEKERGITVDCNEVKFDFRDNKFKLIDTPGHKLYIRNLIEAIYRNSGHGIVGVLVLSVIPSELDSSMSQGQVKEDILLLRAIGVENIVVAVNKMDKVHWNRDAFESSKARVLPILKSAHYREIRFCPISGLEGEGLITDSRLGPSLIDTIVSLNPPMKINERKIPITSDTFKANIFILNCPVFSPGYSGVLHSIAGESDFNIEWIDTGKKKTPFLRSGDKGRISFTCDRKITLSVGDRIILRNNNQTIAYGLIV